MSKQKFYEVTVTNTWRVTVESTSTGAAGKKVAQMSLDGYAVADDYDGAEIISIVEK